MAKREEQDYKVWLEELKKLHPETAANLDAIADTPVGKELFRGERREAEFYRRLNEMTEQERKFQETVAAQAKWYETAKPEYERAVTKAQEAEALRQRLEAMNQKLAEIGVNVPEDKNTPSVPARSSTDDITTRELQELRGQVAQMDQAFPLVMGQFLSVLHKSTKEGFDVDPNQVLKYVYDNKVAPEVAYEQLTKDAREQRRQEELDAKLKEAKEAGRREALSSFQGPERIPLAAPSVVEALRAAKDEGNVVLNPRDRVDAAVRDFLEMTSA